jgi:hypothetical protein
MHTVGVRTLSSHPKPTHPNHRDNQLTNLALPAIDSAALPNNRLVPITKYREAPVVHAHMALPILLAAVIPTLCLANPTNNPFTGRL